MNKNPDRQHLCGDLVNISLKALASTVRNALASKRPLLKGSAASIPLAAGFAAVAMLAVAANMIAQHATVVVRTRVVQPVMQPGSLAAPSSLGPTAAPVLDHEPMAAAIEGFAAAVHGRIAENSASRTEQLRLAAQVLQARTQSFVNQARVLLGSGQVRKIGVQVSAQHGHARELVSIADARRELQQDYQRRLEAIDDRIKGTLDKGWKVFGRIITRQSLLELSRHLDDIRWQLALFSLPGEYSEAHVLKMVSSESAFAAALEKNARGLTRSQGKEWVQQLREDLALLVSTRASMLILDDQQQQSLSSFTKVNTELRSQLRALAETKRAPAASTAPATTRAPAATDISQAMKSSMRTSKIKTDRQSRVLMGAISITVLSVVLLVAVGTRRYQRQLESTVVRRTRELQQLAENDPLTSLPNRRQLFALLNEALTEAGKRDRRVGVFFLDLDNFKNINDSMGHAYGDQVLQEIAARLGEIAARYGFAARLGGDEFTVVYTNAASLEEIHRAGWELVQAFQRPLAIDGRDIVASVSAGASVYPDHEQNAAALVRAADVALFRAKALGRNQLAVFTPCLLRAAAAKFATEQGLRRAIQRGELELLFQPEVRVETLQTSLVEALIRWRLPDGHYVSPAEFLPVAEESGLIMEISDYVLRSAIQAAARWHHGSWPQARVAVNISSRELFDHAFTEKLRALLHEFSLPPSCIEIELTETVLQTGPATIETLRTLRADGIAIALDDFGAGYSSLASLEQLPLTRVKLDRSLIASLDSSARAQAISRAIVGLCQGLGLELTAEGIEREAQLALLLQYPSINLQGYLLSAPVKADGLLEVIGEMPGRMQSLILANRLAALPAHTARLERSRRRSARA